MSINNIDLVKKGKLTSFYFKLLDNVNTKLDSKINDISNKIITEFEAKKLELSKLKCQLDDYNKIKSCVEDLNNYHKYNKCEHKKNIKNISITQNQNNMITTKNLLDTLDDIEVKIEDADFIQYSPNSTTNPDVSLLLKNTDNILNNYNRLLLKKNNNINHVNNQKAVLETKQSNIIINFKNNRVQPEDINIRYFTFPHENKSSFSYINSILGSNDGTTWELITNVNLTAIRNFEKVSLFKFPALVKSKVQNTNYYQYICFKSLPGKEVVPKSQINKYLNRANIPIINFEIFGNYYSCKNENTLENLNENFQVFFDSYINSKYEEASNTIEIDYILNMLLESYRELNNLITDIKVKNVMETILAKNEQVNIQNNDLSDKEIFNDNETKESVLENDILENNTENLIDNILDNILDNDETKKDDNQCNLVIDDKIILIKSELNIFDIDSNDIEMQTTSDTKRKYSKKKKSNKS
jgi:hypothetical protein